MVYNLYLTKADIFSMEKNHISTDVENQFYKIQNPLMI